MTFEATAYFWLLSAVALLFVAIGYRVLWLVKKMNRKLRVENQYSKFIGNRSISLLDTGMMDLLGDQAPAFKSNFCHCSFSERMILLIFNRRGPKKVHS